MGVTHNVASDGTMTMRIHNVRDPHYIDLIVNRNGDMVAFELYVIPTDPLSYFVYPATGKVLHLHEDDQGKPNPVEMIQHSIFRGRVALLCACGLRLDMQAWDLDFGHKIKWIVPQLVEYFRKLCE